ncbi:NUDIX hydrolase [Streptomyces californicus]|uniref:NUDIX hydrolase n=1 Tax=Streptomyces californicus TaxID=67351 RepID=UPI00296ECA36|nr:NUDIX hydrolase [Streptomyces californicus]MDW4918840.1 NUDIX hydrolase [Streptomyces californicus]
MTTKDDSPSTSLTDEEYGQQRAAAALWAGASVLITNAQGEVLVQQVDYRTTHLLPGGAVDERESPAAAAAREVREELGIRMTIDRGLAVDWISPEASSAPPALRFPGEILTVFDGGTWSEDRIADIRLPPSEITAVQFVAPARLPELLSPADARRTLSALRSRINNGGTVLLENGVPITPTVLDRLGVLRTPPPCYRYPWEPGAALPELTVAQAWGWAFAPDGRVLVLLDPHTGTAVLPGGKPEPQDQGDAATTLLREAGEEAAARLGTPLLLGHVTDSAGNRAYLRYAAALTSLGPARPDPATGTTYTRVLITPEQATTLFDWGTPGSEQLTAVHQGRQQLGIPRAAPQPVTELPDPVAW